MKQFATVKTTSLQSNFPAFKRIVRHPVKYRLFLLSKLPMAYIAGLKVTGINETSAIVSVRYKWVNQNPFRSIYFAVLSMAAELSTGLLAFGHIYQRQPAVSMLVVNVQMSFHKKATGTILFTCNNGDDIIKAIEQAIVTNESQTVACTSTGRNEQQEIVAECIITWSFKPRPKQ